MDPNQKAIFSMVERFVKKPPKDVKPAGSLVEALDLHEKEIVSLVGAGGKTTFMFRLAKELSLSGKNLLTTTTTKIFEPVSGETNFLFIHSDEEKVKDFIRNHLHQYHHITVAREKIGAGKLKGVSPGLINEISNLPDLDAIIVEADGAAGRSIKAPREKEPVIPSHTTLVVAILGVDGLERELNEENVFQPERVSELTGIPLGGELSEEGMAILINHPQGIFKGSPPLSRVVVFLNKVDLPNGLMKAKRISQKIFEKRHPQIERIILGQLKREPPVVEVVFP